MHKDFYISKLYPSTKMFFNRTAIKTPETFKLYTKQFILERNINNQLYHLLTLIYRY